MPQQKEENFAIYKVYATHQAGHLEFSSFDFRYGRPGAVLGLHQRQLRSEAPRSGEPVTDMERFFDLFEDRKLAADLFTIVEDARIDFLIRHEYGGIRAALARVQLRELDKRRSVEQLPLREALVENLIRASLNPTRRVRWPASLGIVMKQALAYLSSVQDASAIVEDTAEATLALYDLVEHIPNVMMDSVEDWQEIGQEESLEMLATPGSSEMGDTELDESLASLPQGAEQPVREP